MTTLAAIHRANANYVLHRSPWGFNAAVAMYLRSFEIFNAKDGGLPPVMVSAVSNNSLANAHKLTITGFDWFYWLVLGAAITPFIIVWAWLELAVGK